MNELIDTGSNLEHIPVEEEYSEERNSLYQWLQSWDLGFLFERFLGKLIFISNTYQDYIVVGWTCL